MHGPSNCSSVQLGRCERGFRRGLFVVFSALILTGQFFLLGTFAPRCGLCDCSSFNWCYCFIVH